MRHCRVGLVYPVDRALRSLLVTYAALVCFNSQDAAFEWLLSPTPRRWALVDGAAPVAPTRKASAVTASAVVVIAKCNYLVVFVELVVRPPMYVV